MSSEADAQSSRVGMRPSRTLSPGVAQGEPAWPFGNQDEGCECAVGGLVAGLQKVVAILRREQRVVELRMTLRD
jgi:hypothetical protein